MQCDCLNGSVKRPFTRPGSAVVTVITSHPFISGKEMKKAGASHTVYLCIQYNYCLEDLGFPPSEVEGRRVPSQHTPSSRHRAVSTNGVGSGAWHGAWFNKKTASTSQWQLLPQDTSSAASKCKTSPRERHVKQ